MSDFTLQRKDDRSRASKVNDVHCNETNSLEQLANEVLDIVSLQMVVPIIVPGNVSKTKSSKNVIGNVSNYVIDISKPSTKVQDVDLENLTQTLDSLHPCDQPPNEENIDKILGEKFIEEPPVDIPVIVTFLDDILNDTLLETKDSCDKESLACQDDADIDNPHNGTEKFVEIFFADVNGGKDHDGNEVT